MRKFLIAHGIISAGMSTEGTLASTCILPFVVPTFSDYTQMGSSFRRIYYRLLKMLNMLSAKIPYI